MQIYKNVRELKANLPEVLERIKHCRLLSDTESYIMQLGMNLFAAELTSDTSYGWFASHNAVQESYRNWIAYRQEAEYLQGLVDKLKNYKQHNI